MFWETIVLVLLALLAFYEWSIATYDFFKIRKVPFDKPFPLLGGQKNVIFRKVSLLDNIVKIYDSFDTKFFGFFDTRVPILVIKDPELIRQVTVKEFDHFTNHRTIFSDSDGGLFANSLFAMANQKWKDMRATLSPAFTGSKMRLMYQLIQEVCTQAVAHLKKENKELEIDMKEYFTRFTNDVIASTAFGIKVDSLNDKENEFYSMGKKITTFTAWRNIKFFIFMSFKKFAKLFRIKPFEDKYNDYFMDLVLDAMKYRAENGIVRPDMINMLMEATGRIKSDESKDAKPIRSWTDEEIVAQCFLFFFAGFETASVLMCFAAHEVMENPEVQDKLVAEIDEVLENLNGAPVTYEALQKMKYLDAVLSETLRKWPPAPAVDRVCNKNIKLEDPDNDLSIEVKVGENIWVPIAGLHRDERFFPNPKVFDPERFSDENKANIHPATYIPFGIGPRICIASRFALLESKAMLFHLLKDFRLEASKKSTIPLELSSSGFQLTAKNGFWLKLVPRT